jgi:3,2-trans-enoyl-CoA isomerase|tara:strand:- start:3119 stop:3805 length:687 start_codon:yes stop_codon:yes gene_type:complete
MGRLTVRARVEQVHGVIFASGLRRSVFTAGNDIAELYAPKTTWKRYREFWLTQTTFLSRLLSTRLATVCAIRGACPAGGCVVALCCDYRLQTTSGSLGLNEVALGIAVPKYWAELFLYRCIDRVKGESLLQRGVLVRPLEAQSLGLIDEVVGEGALMSAAASAMERYLKLPSSARATTKRTIRSHFSASWAAYAEEEAKGGWKMLNEPHIVKALGGVLMKLSGGKAKL